MCLQFRRKHYEISMLISLDQFKGENFLKAYMTKFFSCSNQPTCEWYLWHKQCAYSKKSLAVVWPILKHTRLNALPIAVWLDYDCSHRMGCKNSVNFLSYVKFYFKISIFLSFSIVLL